MTPVMLIEALASELEEAVKHFRCIAELQPPKRVRVYRQAVPQEEFEVDSFYPFIIVELLSFEDTPEGSLASILLTLGTYHGERRADYWREHLNILEEIRQYILSHRTIGRQFILNLPTYGGMVEPQSESFLYSNMFLQYYIAQPIPSVPYQF